MGAMPGMKPTGKKAKKAKGKFQGGRSGNPAKRAVEPVAETAPTGSGFGLGAAAPQPSDADLSEIQKLFGKN